MVGRRATIVGCALVVVVGAALASSCMNARVVRELRENPQGERAKKTMVLTMPSGRECPVNYLREGNTVYAGADFPWWRELRPDGGRGSVLIQGETYAGFMRAVEDDPELRTSVFARLRPNAIEWWGVLVVIELEGPSEKQAE